MFLHNKNVQIQRTRTLFSNKESNQLHWYRTALESKRTDTGHEVFDVPLLLL